MEPTGVSRRALTGAASLGLAAPVLAACGDEEPQGATDRPGAGESSSGSSTRDPSPSQRRTAEPETGGGGGLASAAEVPVGGGLVLADRELVITQPTKGDFRGFTAVCTHQGCLVGDVGDTINCSCHGSRFSITDGSVLSGPAGAPLAERPLVVDGDAIDLA